MKLYKYKLIPDSKNKYPINGQTYLNFPSLTTEQQNKVEDYAVKLANAALKEADNG